MIIDDRIRYEKLRYNIIREAAEMSASSSRKINKYEYFTGEEIYSLYRAKEITKKVYNNITI